MSENSLISEKIFFKVNLNFNSILDFYSEREFFFKQKVKKTFPKSGQGTGWFSLISGDIFCTSTADLKINQNTFQKGGCRYADFSLISVRVKFFWNYFRENTPTNAPNFSNKWKHLFAPTINLKNKPKNFSKRWVHI